MKITIEGSPRITIEGTPEECSDAVFKFAKPIAPVLTAEDFQRIGRSCDPGFWAPTSDTYFYGSSDNRTGAPQ